MSERILRFGPRSGLVGILSTPEASGASQRPAVLMWNVGVNHRVGPYRTFVELARELASQGFVSLRFDVSGLGDSEARRDLDPEQDPADVDLADAMSALTRRTGIERFVLLGFCSGVDAAHRVAVKDPRVVGVIQLEGYAYATPGFWLRFPFRVLSRAKWERRLRHGLEQLKARLCGGEAAPSYGNELVYERDYPDWSHYRCDLVTLSQRGVAQLFVYVGLDSAFNHSGQFWEMFGSPELDRQLLEVQYLPRADHVFYDLEARRSMCAYVVDFLRARFPALRASEQATREELG